MAIATLIVAICSALISLISAFAAIRATRPKPKLKGWINHALTMGIGLNDEIGKEGFGVAMYIILTNASSHPVHPLAYELKVKVKGVWHEGVRMQNFQASMPPFFFSDYRAHLDIESLIDWPPRSVNHGEPLMGFLAFLVMGTGDREGIQEYQLTIVDVFGNRTRLKMDSEEAQKNFIQGKPFTPLEAFIHAGARVERIKNFGSPNISSRIEIPAQEGGPVPRKWPLRWKSFWRDGLENT